MPKDFDKSLRKLSFNPSPTFIEDPVRRIVELYRKKKYLEDKPPFPFTKKPSLRTQNILGKPYKE